ncbi:hypothetical protein [Acaryochloris sp. CCMEE 5410]|uniref:hypothetical protein n=1 Tax=Acaryochloris sp. CCMEE 5410 TaxID=310037 RepID=UPI0002483DF2|nr:hypothetical protein [Acaryochloris sp. CCMEE 5410]
MSTIATPVSPITETTPVPSQPYFQGMAWNEHQSVTLLSSLKTVATLQGQRPMHPLAKDMMQAIQDHLLQWQGSIENLPIISPEVMGRELIGRHQELALQFLILMPYLSMQVETAEVELVQQFAQACSHQPHTLKSLKQVHKGQLRGLLWDYSVRSLVKLLPGRWWQKLGCIVSAMHQYIGDPKTAQQYQALGELPAGTLGKALYQYYRDLNFPLPGEKKSFSDILVPHDLIHVLSGIDTSPVGEIVVAGFEAGMSGSQFGFELLLEVVLDFHLGLEFTTLGILDPSQNNFIPSLVIQAFVQGTAVRQDLFSPDWSFSELLEQPILTIRDDYNIETLDLNRTVGLQVLPLPQTVLASS